jgi:hypothetical protein
MTTLHSGQINKGGLGNLSLLCRSAWICALAATLCLPRVSGQDQEDPLNKVHVPPPTATATPATGAPAGAEAPAATGAASLKIRPGERIRLNVDMVLVPVTITDPMNRLVTGLEKEDFQQDRQLCRRGCARIDRDYLRPLRLHEHQADSCTGVDSAVH